MQSDEQILAKTTELLANLQEKCWDGYKQVGLKKKGDRMVPNCVPVNEKVLREVTEDEMRVIEDILDDLDGDALSLSNVFGDKKRIIVDFPTMDTDSDLGKFVDFFQKQEWDVEWPKGLATAVRELVDDVDLLDVGRVEPKTKAIRMKIGKLFAKIADLTAKQAVLLDKINAEQPKNAKKHDNLGGFLVRRPDGEYGNPKAKKYTSPGQVPGVISNKVLGDEGAKRFSQLYKQMRLYIPNPGLLNVSFADREEWARKNAKYWQENAGYIKKNIQNLTNDKYSIIITRHPIDVLRMSDFDNITSCHSPPSRAGGTNEYYKCAAAEAQGHGAVAYIVETEELLTNTNTSNIESAEQEIQEGEIFGDDARFGGAGFDINPISRVRLRKMRYQEDSEIGAEDLAVPEKRVYGAAIPGFIDRVVEWARQSQQQQIENLPKKDGKYDLNKFKLYGGSYEDTAGWSGRQELMMQLLNNYDFQAFSGRVGQNTQTENDLDADLLGDVRGMYEEECEEIASQWNRRYENCKVDFSVEDDGADGVYILANATITLRWDYNEFTKLPNAYENVVQDSPWQINNYFGDLLNDSGAHMGLAQRMGPIEWQCTVNMEHPDLGGSAYFALPEEFNEFCSKVDTVIDDRRDTMKQILENYFRREEIMPGGKFMNLAIAIENNDISSYEWDVETDGNYDDAYEVYASYNFDYDIEEVKMNEKILMQILNSRDYKIQLRRNLLAIPQKEEDTEYFLSTKIIANKYVEGEIRVSVTFFVNRDNNDEMVDLFKELVEGDMDDEDNLMVIFNKTLAEVRNFHGIWPEQEGPATKNINEVLVMRWKRFLA
tara:strand:+ start:6459 stop:8942 length:2484 start_codon:yes stop_codon:yes gene_type:complete